uniref:phosphatidylinositol-3,5-bisphosphate 3-phosphatase n=1 Tax=Daphnia magna TaxID=35525 RepID=A0A0P5Q1A2_9CRUS
MNCATYPWMKLAHSVTIPCVSQMLSSNVATVGGGGEHDSIGKSTDSSDGKSETNQGSGPDGQLNRSLSFDGRRKVWARVEAHWARVTLDRSVPSGTANSADKHDPQGAIGEQPFYQRIRSWLTNNPQTQTYQQSPVMTKIENVRMLDRYNNRKPSTGTLYLTATHLIFVDPDAKKETWVLLMHVATVQKLPLSTVGAPLQIRCKTFLSVTFVLPRERECHDLYTSLMQMSQPFHIEDLYCFHYTSSLEEIPRTAGWTFFDLETEFQRMGVPNSNWTMTNLNKDYQLCDTYPQCLFVPSSVSTIVLVGSASFRSKGRLPVLTYLHKNQAALCRCSQPLSGFSARCVEDEQLLNGIVQANPNAKFMYVVDTRPRINAMANRAAGKGYENENFYENIKFQFCGIENIHVMRSSLSKLLEACELKTPSMAAFINGVQSSGWLRHIHAILDTSLLVARSLQEGVNVLVHCSDGWDRTAQVCSLAQVLLDPYYRTLQGFQSLIEKDWLSFGHKFTDRCGYLQSDAKETSPVFTQLVDCMWQLQRAHPSAFQFSERLLLHLHDHVYSSQYGTFVGNCEKDRLDLKLSDRTYSLWGNIASHLDEFLNPLYKSDAYTELLEPNLVPSNILFWRGLYCRFESGVHPRESIADVLLATRDHSTSLEMHIAHLQKRITAMKTLLDVSTPVTDNRLAVDDEDDEQQLGLRLKKSMQVVDDHPLSTSKSADSVFSDGPNIENSITSSYQLRREIDSVCIDWRSLRNIKECVCSTPFDHSSKKSHCWRCGEVFCTRCLDKQTPLPGHATHRPVPVCRACYREVRLSSSSITST